MNETAAQRIPGGGLWGAEQVVYGSLPSTNRWALAHADQLAHGTVVRARRQVAGHGRFDRPWITPGQCCLTLSVFLQPTPRNGLPDAILLPTAALAVHATLDEFGIACRLKWPNDVMTDRGKIAGILAASNNASHGLVLGIGLNVNVTAPALATMNFVPPPTSMAVERERFFDLDLVCRRLLVFLEKTIDLVRLQGSSFVLDRWSAADDLAGKQIEINEDSRKTSGAYGGLHETGQLRLVDADGRTHLFWSGDVTLQTS